MQGTLKIGIRPATANARYDNNEKGEGKGGFHNACLTSISGNPLQAVPEPL